MLSPQYKNDKPNAFNYVDNFSLPSMSQFGRNSNARERAAGLSFSALFADDYSVRANGGECFGGCYADNGLFLDGTSGHAEYAVPAGTTFSDDVSFVVEFYPDFNWDTYSTIVIYDTQPRRNSVLKMSSSLGSVLRIFMSATNVADIPSATYSAHWKQGEKNVIVVSGTSGNTSVWLNGVKILDAASTAWTKGDVATTYIGSYYTGTALYFDGNITKFQIYQNQLNAAAASDLYNYGTFRNGTVPV